MVHLERQIGFWVVVLLLSIFCQPAPAAAPQAVSDLEIIISGSSNQLNWSRPATDNYGNPVALFEYNIYTADLPWFAPLPEQWLTAVSTPGFTLSAVSEAAFYRVTASGETVIPLPGLLVYYPFNADALDWSGNDQHGELQQDAAADQYLQIGDNDQDHVTLPAEIFNGLQNFTLSASVMIANLHTDCDSGHTPAHSLVNCGTHSLINTFWIAYLPHSHQWLLHIYYNNLIDFFPIPEDLWLHLTFIRDGNLLSLYLDGHLLNSQPALGGGVVEVEPGGAVIGQDQDNFGDLFETCQSWSGGIANMRVYDRALNEEEVSQLYLQDQMMLP